MQAEDIASHYLPHWSRDRIDAMLRCFDVKHLREQLVRSRLVSGDTSDDAVVSAYFSRAECRAFSPNLLLNEPWYRTNYPDVAEATSPDCMSGFVHFVMHGMRESRWPNESLQAVAETYGDPETARTRIDAQSYLRLNASARAFLDAFPILAPLDHYNLFGRFLHLVTEEPQAFAPRLGASAHLIEMEREFDKEFYTKTYLDGSVAWPDRADPFRHYLTVGIDRQYSPNAWFEEDWYRAFYPDIPKAIPEHFICGFQHYLAIGRTERRLPHFDLKKSLELQLPNVTDPVLVNRAYALKRRMFDAGLRAYRKPAGADDLPTVWFLLPTISPDIAFGGYTACFELIRATRAAGFPVSIYTVSDTKANKAYFMWRQRSAQLRAAFEDVTFLSRNEDHKIGIGPRDRIVAYSVLDLYTAASLAAWTDFDRPFLLAQEYEPIFFDNSSNRVLTNEAYGVPHYPLINSEPLHEYFKRQKVGIFASGRELAEPEDYIVFEHRINQLPRQTAASMRSRERRTLALYARPEGHAARNLFEIAMIALQNLCDRGAFGPEWSFVGLGALSEIEPIDLGAGHRLVLLERTSEEEYRELVDSLDIGVSLMFAPHPGVVALEFATTGALVVTNVYENRSAADLIAQSANIVPCDPGLADVERAILEALGRVEDFEARERDVYRPVLQSWSEIFPPGFVEKVFRVRATAP